MKTLLLIVSLLLIHPMTNDKEKIQTDLPLKYLVHTSGSTKDRPLIIFLHGYGSNEEDLFALRSELLPEYTYISIRAPIHLFGAGYQWFSLQPPAGGLAQVARELSDSTKLLEDFIKAVARKYETPAEKIILVGFSQGGIMSYELALKKPQVVRAMAALGSMMLPTLQQQITPGTNLYGLDVFIGHGVEDNRIPLSSALATQQTLLKTSIKPEYHAYNGLGHSINNALMKDLHNWILKVVNTPRKI